MKKKILLYIILVLTLLFSTTTNVAFSQEVTYYLGGYPAGIELTTRGALVVGTCDVVTENGVISPSKSAGIMSGDKILYIDNAEINDAFDVEKSLNNTNEKLIMIERGDEILNFNVSPVKDINGNYKLGVFIKNGVNGIGTITYFTNNGKFASLGHPVFLNNKIAEIKKGTLYSCSITGFNAGESSKPGELKGVFIKDKILGRIDKNVNNGVYGVLNKNFNYDKLQKIELGDGNIGEASIYTTINGSTPKEYSISIVKTDYRESCLKNFVIKVTDKELLSKTGGIIQGMSGSPIIQNGKLIGAITHVFTNDPTRGFGISINNMINN